MPVGVAFSEDYKSAFLALVREGRNPRTAAPLIGFKWDTIKGHLEHDHEFRAQLADAEMHPIALVEDALFRNAVDGDLGAQKFYLANRAGHRWADDRTRAAGAMPAGAGGANPEILVAAVRDVLTDPSTREVTVTMLTSVPLPGQLPIETTATEND